MEHSMLKLEILFSCLQIKNHSMRQKILETNIFFYLSSIFTVDFFERNIWAQCVPSMQYVAKF